MWLLLSLSATVESISFARTTLIVLTSYGVPFLRMTRYPTVLTETVWDMDLFHSLIFVSVSIAPLPSRMIHLLWSWELNASVPANRLSISVKAYIASRLSETVRTRARFAVWSRKVECATSALLEFC